MAVKGKSVAAAGAGGAGVLAGTGVLAGKAVVPAVPSGWRALPKLPANFEAAT